MAVSQTKPGEVVDVRPLGPAPDSAQTATLLRVDQVEVRRLVVPAGKEIPEPQARGEIVVHCLEGRVAYTAFGKEVVPFRELPCQRRAADELARQIPGPEPLFRITEPLPRRAVEMTPADVPELMCDNRRRASCRLR